jgi:hypothetical protein
LNCSNVHNIYALNKALALTLWGVEGGTIGIYALEDPNIVQIQVALEDPPAESKFRLRWRIRLQDPNALYAGGSVLSPRGSVCKIERVGLPFGTICRTNVG